jgi:hypothetical protein
MNHPSVHTADGTEVSESHRRTGPLRLTNKCADGIGGTFILRWRGTPVNAFQQCRPAFTNVRHRSQHAQRRPL